MSDLCITKWVKASKDLRGYFGEKNISFTSNREYVLLPNHAPIESLFPSTWLEEMENDHPTWIKIERDALNAIVDLNLASSKKVNIAQWLLKKCDEVTVENKGTYSWASEFIKIFKLIDEMLFKLNKSLVK